MFFVFGTHFFVFKLSVCLNAASGVQANAHRVFGLCLLVFGLRLAVVGLCLVVFGLCLAVLKPRRCAG